MGFSESCFRIARGRQEIVSCPPPSYLGITHTESLFAGYILLDLVLKPVTVAKYWIKKQMHV